MDSTEAAYNEMLSLPPLCELGEAHLRIIRSAHKMNEALHETTKNERGFTTSHQTDFARLVADDEIAWWVRERIAGLDVLRPRTVEAREALQKLLEDAKELQSRDAPTTYLGLVESVSRLCTSNAAQIATLLQYVKWLEESGDLGPSILFTYKIWGSTRLAEREFHGDPGLSDEDQLRICTEWATGLRTRGSYVLDEVTRDLSSEIADSIGHPATIALSKRFQKGYNWEFMDRIRANAR